MDRYELYLKKARENRKKYHEKMKDNPEYKEKQKKNWKRWSDKKKKTTA